MKSGTPARSTSPVSHFVTAEDLALSSPSRWQTGESRADAVTTGAQSSSPRAGLPDVPLPPCLRSPLHPLAQPLLPSTIGPEASEPPRPTTLVALRAYAYILTERQYVTNLLSMCTTTLGGGILDAACLTLLSALGHAGKMNVNTIQNFQRLKTLVHSVGMVQAHVGLDAEFAHHDSPAQVLAGTALFSRGILVCSAADIVSAVLLGATVGGVGAGTLPTSVVLYAVASVQATLAYKMVRQYGFWGCLKKHLGPAQARREQHRWNRVITALEMFLLTSLFEAASYAGTEAAQRRCSTAEAKLRMGAVLGATGGLLASLPKLFFWLQAGSARTTLKGLVADAERGESSSPDAEATGAGE